MNRLFGIFGSLCIIVLLFSGCDSTLKCKKIEITRLPNKTEYYIGEDRYLELSGGTVTRTDYEGHSETRDMLQYAYRHELDDDYGITSNVNFDVPGTYTVTIWETSKKSCQFQVKVVDRANESGAGSSQDG